MNTDKFEKQCEYCEQPKDYAPTDDHCAPISTGDIITLAAGAFAFGILIGSAVTIWMV